MMTKVEQIETVLRERYLSFRLHHADLKTMASPERFADLFVEWSSSAVLAALTLPAETEGVEVEALAPLLCDLVDGNGYWDRAGDAMRERYRHAARVLAASGYSRRPADMEGRWGYESLADWRRRTEQPPAESGGLAERVRALADEWDRTSVNDHEEPCEDESDCARCCARDLRALLDAPTQEDNR